jgi:prephenate dehydrogenase
MDDGRSQQNKPLAPRAVSGAQAATQNGAPPLKGPLFKRVTIIGVGLLGASLGMALRAGALAGHVTGVGRPGSESLKTALQRGAVDEITTDLSQGAAGADLIILATNISAFPSAMNVLAEASRPDCLITDVGSTKSEVMRMARERLPNRCFVGSHPMAGSEKSGPENARADLYRGALCLVVPPEGTVPAAGGHAGKATERIITFWQALGMRTHVLDSVTHDQWVAIVSHVPHLLAALMVNLTQDNPPSRMAAAGGFVDTTRVASGNVDMWTDILVSNRQAIKLQLLQIAEQLDGLHAALDRNDAPAVRHWLSSAKAIRDQMLMDRGRQQSQPAAIKH